MKKAPMVLGMGSATNLTDEGLEASLDVHPPPLLPAHVGLELGFVSVICKGKCAAILIGLVSRFVHLVEIGITGSELSSCSIV